MHAGILDHQQRVAPTGSPSEWKPVGAIREIQRAISELAFPENDGGDDALRTLIANPVELASLEADLFDRSPRTAPTAHGGKPRSASWSAMIDEDGADSEPCTLIASSPFEGVRTVDPEREARAASLSVRTEPDPVCVVIPKNTALTPSDARGFAALSPSAAAERREVEEAPTMVATPDPRLRSSPDAVRNDATGAGRQQSVVIKDASPTRGYIALAFAGGLCVGLALLFVLYALFGT